MDNTKTLDSLNISGGKRNENLAFDFFVQIPQRLQNCLKPHFKQLAKYGERAETAISVSPKVNCGYSSVDVNLEKQLQAWKENPTWVDHSPEIKVSVPKGSLCNLNVKFNVGLPPDAVYNIVIDPDNRRVFKNIKEVISRRVLVDEGLRQVVEVEQAALWRFLWWSGTISVHVVVDQNRIDHSVRFKQQKTGFMKRFEGCWRVEPLFVDEQLCSPIKPRTWADYESCSGGKGRVGSVVSLEQLIQPALLPPPPLSWYLRGITTRTTEMLISDLLAETARLRGGIDKFGSELAAGYKNPMQGCENYCDVDLKERWRQKRNMRRRHRNSRRKLIHSL